MAKQPEHICFYSNKCEWSRIFITELATTPYKSEFKFVCVDPSPQRAALPGWLKKVPTLVVRGENEPRTDSEVMNWLYERRLKEGGGRSAPAGQGAGAGAAEGDAGAGDPEPFIMNEMGGGPLGSDMYTFLDADMAVEGNGGARIQHSYSFLNGAGGPGPRPGGQTQLTDHNNKRSKKEELFDKQMEEYTRHRENGMPSKVMRQ